MGTFAAAGIVLIAPWTNNGINVLGVLFALLAGAFGLLYRPGRKGIKIMKDGEAVATGMLFASLLIVPLELWEMDSVI
jgi:inner membrane transporter RhtA